MGVVIFNNWCDFKVFPENDNCYELPQTESKELLYVTEQDHLMKFIFMRDINMDTCSRGGRRLGVRPPFENQNNCYTFWGHFATFSTVEGFFQHVRTFFYFFSS